MTKKSKKISKQQNARNVVALPRRSPAERNLITSGSAERARYLTSSQKYLSTLIDPFDATINAKVPDVCGVPTATTQLYYSGSFLTSSTGAGGFQLSLSNCNSVVAGYACASMATENPATTTDSAFAYNASSGLLGGNSLYSLANGVRVVSAGIRCWSEQAPIYDSGAFVGYCFNRDDAFQSSVSGLLGFSNSIRVPAKRGIQITWKPIDYLDWAFGPVTTSVPVGGAQNNCNAQIRCHITGGVYSASYQFMVVVNVEYTPSPSIFLPGMEPSPIDPEGHSRVLDFLNRYFPQVLDAETVTKMSRVAMTFGMRYLAGRLGARAMLPLTGGFFNRDA